MGAPTNSLVMRIIFIITIIVIIIIIIRSPSLPAIARKRSQPYSIVSYSAPNITPNPLQPRIVLTNAESVDRDSLKSKSFMSMRALRSESNTSKVSPSPCVSTQPSCDSFNKSSSYSLFPHRSNSMVSQSRLWDHSFRTLNTNKESRRIRGKNSISDDGEYKNIS